jgi:hypothetical protein
VLTTHGSQLLRVTPRDAGRQPATPTLVRGKGSTASSVTLSWDASEYQRGISGYEVVSGGRTVASTSDTSVTVSGLSAATGYSFSVVAVGGDGRKSAPSKALDVTIPAGGGPVAYEAETSGNALEGGASVAGCGGCSGGAKAGNLGGSGSLTYKTVTAPADGTYLMKIDYVDASSGRAIVVTVNGTGFQLPTPGSADNAWDVAQTVTVPVRLKAGANTVKFGNPSDFAPDIDRIVV